MKAVRLVLPAVLAIAALILSCNIAGDKRFSVSYEGNGATAGQPPEDAASYEPGATVAVLGQNDLERSGYVFAGWNSAANRSGTARAPGDRFTMGQADVVLYAQWVLPTYSLLYDANGASYGSPPSDPTGYLEGASAAVLGRGGIVRVDHSFSGWNAAADGTGTLYQEGSSFSMGGANATLYADWEPLGYLQALYLPNGATSGEALMDSGEYHQGDMVTVRDAGALSRADFVFDGWNTAPDGSGTDYAAGSSFAMGSAGLVLYAQWRLPMVSFSVYGGSAVPELLSNDIPAFPESSRDGFALEGWCTDSGFSTKVSFPLRVSADTTLHAKWIASTSGLAFTAIAGGYSVTRGTVSDVDVIIPAYWIGKPVVDIPGGAFSGFTNLRSIDIADSVTSMGTYVFYECQQLITAKLPAGLASVPNSTFEGCGQLTTVTLPPNAASIGANAFSYCEDLVGVDLPAGLQSIGSRAFFHCYQLSSLGSIEIFSGITTIPASCFEDCINLDIAISLPNIVSIGNRALLNGGIISLSLGPNLVSIGEQGIFQCIGLLTMTVEAAAVPETGDGALYNLASLTDIFVPSGSVDLYKASPEWSDHSSLIKAIP